VIDTLRSVVVHLILSIGRIGANPDDSAEVRLQKAIIEREKEEFFCEPRGTVHVKGKGEMAVWHVLGAKKTKSDQPHSDKR
jgi:hypothetical protein